MTRGTIALDAGPADAIRPGRFTLVEHGARRIGVTRLPDGTLRAIRDRCPHKGAAICQGLLGGTWVQGEDGGLALVREGTVLACPWHGYEYDLATGAELFWPGAPGLRLYPVEERDGRVVVTIPATSATPA